MATTVVGPGEVQLFSNVVPALLPGDYLVSVTQPVVDLSDGVAAPDPLMTQKPLKVLGPDAFKLDPKFLHSFYPQEGEPVPSRILPHVVLSDAHLPWEIDPDTKGFTKGLEDVRVPWFALLVLTAEELHHIPSRSPPLEPSTTLTVTTTRKTLLEIAEADPTTKLKLPFRKDQLSPGELDSRDNFIFLDGAAFTKAFAPRTEGETRPAVSHFAYAAHIRRSHNPNISTGDDFSVIVGQRSGPPKITEAKTAYAHLVSLVDLQNSLDTEVKPDDTVALISLLSWSYQWVPESEAGLSKVLDKLQKNIVPLARKASADDAPATPDESDAKDAAWLEGRLKQGYAFVKHRVPSGETTFALYRGPLMPNRLRADELKTNEGGLHGAGLQIIDASTGIIDISYSVAWELGRSLALGHSVFMAAISILRRQIANTSSPEAHQALGDSGTAGSDNGPLPDWLSNLQTIAGDTNNSSGKADQQKSNAAISNTSNRWRGAMESRKAQMWRPPQVNIDNPTRVRRTREWLESMVDKLISERKAVTPETTTEKDVTQEGTSFSKVVDFVCNDLISLEAVSANHLFPEPDILDDEAIKTFYVDLKWIDALVDGALSVGNHDTSDNAKDEIKNAINKYIKTATEQQSGNLKISMPRWGFIMCGPLVSTFPDMHLSTDELALIRSTNLQKDSLMALFSCYPEFLAKGVMMAQPSHQQRFAVGYSLDENQLRIELDLIPTSGVFSKESQQKKDVELTRTATQPDTPSFYDFETGYIDLPKLARVYGAFGRGGVISDQSLSSIKGSPADVATVLGDKLFEFNVISPENLRKNTDNSAPPEFQLNFVDALAEPIDHDETNSSKGFLRSSAILAPSMRVMPFHKGSIPLTLNSDDSVAAAADGLVAAAEEAPTEVIAIRSTQMMQVKSRTKALEIKEEVSDVESYLATSYSVLESLDAAEEASPLSRLLISIKPSADRKPHASSNTLLRLGLYIYYPFSTPEDDTESQALLPAVTVTEVANSHIFTTGTAIFDVATLKANVPSVQISSAAPRYFVVQLSSSITDVDLQAVDLEVVVSGVAKEGQANIGIVEEYLWQGGGTERCQGMIEYCHSGPDY